MHTINTCDDVGAVGADLRAIVEAVMHTDCAEALFGFVGL